MGSAWIEVHDDLPDHRKLRELGRVAKWDTAKAMGHLTMFWLWALRARDQGVMHGDGVQDLADGMRITTKKASAIVPEMTRMGWLEERPAATAEEAAAGGVRLGEKVVTIHDWEDYVGRLLEKRERKRENDRDRQRRRRARKAREVTGDVTRDVGGESRFPARSTGPDRTAAAAAGQKAAAAAPDDLEEIEQELLSGWAPLAAAGRFKAAPPELDPAMRAELIARLEEPGWRRDWSPAMSAAADRPLAIGQGTNGFKLTLGHFLRSGEVGSILYSNKYAGVNGTSGKPPPPLAEDQLPRDDLVCSDGCDCGGTTRIRDTHGRDKRCIQAVPKDSSRGRKLLGSKS